MRIAVPDKYPNVDRVVKALESFGGGIGGRYANKKYSKRSVASILKTAKKAGLNVLGHGADRYAVALSSDSVMKIPINASGIEANLRELELWSTSDDEWREVLMPVLAADRNGLWIVMPRAWGDHISEDDLEQALLNAPEYFEERMGDTTAHNWYEYDGRYVLVDYG